MNFISGERTKAMRRVTVLALALITIFLLACSGSANIEPANSYATLADALDAAGMKIESNEENQFLFSGIFSVPGREIVASGESLLAFEFPSETETDEQLALVSEDGYGIGLKYINWVNDPYFFRNGTLVVVYDGDTSLVKTTLEEAMNEPIISPAIGS